MSDRGIFTSPSEESFVRAEDIKRRNTPSPEFITPVPSAKDFKYWSERLIQRKEDFKESQTGLNNVEIRLPTTSCIALISDQHIGGADVDYKRIEQEVNTILTTPNMYAIFLGDAVDGFFFNPAQMEEIEQVPEQYEYIRAMFKVLGQEKKVLAGLQGDHDCLDEKTEVYTQEDGWITYDKLTQKHHLLTLNPTTRFPEWSQYEKKIVEKFNGNLNRLVATHYDMAVTDKHRVLTENRRDGDFKFVNGNNLQSLNDSDIIPQAVECGKDDLGIPDYQLTLVGWALTDASLNKNELVIYQSKPKVVKKIQQFLTNNKIQYREVVRQRTRDEICGKKVGLLLPAHEFYINEKTSQEIIKLLNGNKYNLPNWTKELSQREFEVLLEAMIDGDGSRFSNKSSCFYKKNKQLIDQLQFLCIIHEKRAFIYEYIGRSGETQYRLNITNTLGTRCAGPKIFTEPYEGIIWDVSIPPNRNFLVRRNGKPYFTGNSWAKKMGLSAYSYFNEQTGGVLLEGVSFITIHVGSQEYKIACAHRLPGNSIYNKNHPQMRLEKFGGGFGADIIVSGHNHQKSYAQTARTVFGGESQRVHYLALGAYKSTDDYAKKLGFSQQSTQEMYGMGVHLFEDQKKIRVYEDILEAAQEL